MTNGDLPMTLTGCEVLPPMEPRSTRHTAERRDRNAPEGFSGRKAKGKTPGSRSGRWWTLNAFLDATLAMVSNNGVRVWLLLFRDTKPDGLARTAISDLVRRSGVSKQSVHRAVKELEINGLLTVVHRGGLRRGMNIYRVLATPSATPQIGSYGKP